MTARQNIKDTKEAILESLKWNLENDEDTDFNQVVFEAVDTEIGNYSREECIQMIDETGNEQYIDEGIIDRSSLDRTLITMAFGCLEQEIYNDTELSNIGRDMEDHNFEKDDDEYKDLLNRINTFF